ncbi:unnamed protein product, partial [Closterium sp. NIES-53]
MSPPPSPGQQLAAQQSFLTKKMVMGGSVVLWIALSFSVIIFNKYILDSRLLNWPFPI